MSGGATAARGVERTGGGRESSERTLTPTLVAWHAWHATGRAGAGRGGLEWRECRGSSSAVRAAHPRRGHCTSTEGSGMGRGRTGRSARRTEEYPGCHRTAPHALLPTPRLGSVRPGGLWPCLARRGPTDPYACGAAASPSADMSRSITSPPPPSRGAARGIGAALAVHGRPVFGRDGLHMCSRAGPGRAGLGWTAARRRDATRLMSLRAPLSHGLQSEKLAKNYEALYYKRPNEVFSLQLNERKALYVNHKDISSEGCKSMCCNIAKKSIL